MKIRKKIFLHKIEATSLVETIVALVVIMSVFSIGMMVYFNVLKSSYSLQQLKASLLLNELAKITKEKKTFFDEEDSTETWTVYKKVTKKDGMSNLILLDFEVINKDKKQLATRRELIVLQENE